MKQDMRSQFTGRHMAAILVAFFGVVIAINLVMATFASRTFGGMIVENSYVASQKFNGWLEKARAEKALGWSLAVKRGGARSSGSFAWRGCAPNRRRGDGCRGASSAWAYA